MPDLYFQSADGEDHQIKVPQSFRSEVYTYTGNPEIVFYKMRSAADGSQVREPVCRYMVNGSSKDWLFLFVRDGKSGTIRVFGMDDSLASFPFGSSRYFNLSNRTLGIIYGKNKFKMDPNSYETALPEIGPNQNVQLQILAIRNEKLQDIFNSQWPQESSVRYLIFIIESETRRDRVEVKSIAEYKQLN
ncbi:hypothetical protein [Cerasicoccus arenae]|uniref:Uncharacterized protein n=2 Tax=Cerasicoccus arenae TaxID=424488 RepID=A0A8J3DFS7_9BACT|nr:hypothetical protein [Cerasicoccus arenae]MBK1859275.1 hypothetical protein [Cerasicoccus arenae]GHC01567.1 hypothetical protein GCM10007047_17620 [Cerasicoccus arenae]